MKNFLLGLLLALATSTIALEKHPDGSVTLLPAEAVVIDFQIGQLKQDLAKAALVIKYFEKRVQELERGVCI